MRKGMSLIELLVVIAVMAVILSMAAFSGRRTLLSQEQAAFLRSLQGLFWQGATEAASRGETLILSRQGNRLEIRRGNQVLQSLNIPPGVNLSLGDGDIVRFTPPGKVESPSGSMLSSPLSFTVSVGSRNYTYRVSLIGEVKVSP